MSSRDLDGESSRTRSNRSVERFKMSFLGRKTVRLSNFQIGKTDETTNLKMFTRETGLVICLLLVPSRPISESRLLAKTAKNGLFCLNFSATSAQEDRLSRRKDPNELEQPLPVRHPMQKLKDFFQMFFHIFSLVFSIHQSAAWPVCDRRGASRQDDGRLSFVNHLAVVGEPGRSSAEYTAGSAGC